MAEVFESFKPHFPVQRTADLNQQEAIYKQIRAYAIANGLEPGKLLDATLGASTNWKDHLDAVMAAYTEYGGTVGAPAPPAMQASTRRARVQCYCLVCRRKVAPAGVRLTGNRCSGFCPVCGGKVSSFVSVPAKKRTKRT